MTSKLPTPVTQPSLAERFRADVVVFIIACFILHLFISFFDFLLRPLKALSPREAADKVDGNIEEKRIKRLTRRRKGFGPDDPMEQFYLRFVTSPQEYRGDAVNEVYFAWFQEWKKGNIIDSDLRWAPDILEGEEIRDNFIQYMKIQLDLHKKASPLKKMLFVNTLFKFYPELSASMRGLEEDLAQYEAEIDEDGAETELQEEIEAFGLPTELALYLIKKDLSAKKLKENVILLKKWVDKGFDETTCICALENNITHETAVQIIQKIICEMNLPPKVVVAFLRKQIDDEQLYDIAETMQGLCESWGMDIYDNAPGTLGTHFDQFIDVKLREFRGKKVVKHMNRKS